MKAAFKSKVEGVLPESFRPFEVESMARLGRPQDGGYIVNLSDVEKSTSLLSFGVNDDWSFERDFLRIKPIPLIAFDASVSSVYFIKKAAIAFFKFYRPQSFIHWVGTLFSYNLFFRGSRKHERKYVGRFTSDSFVSLTQALRLVKTPENRSLTFLKIDIEGHEYRLLDELIENQDMISGLAIEFHDVDIHLKKIEWFIENFSLKLVHVHANNYSPITIEGTPLAVECSFSSSVSRSVRKTRAFSHLDQPCNPSFPEIELCFVNAKNN